MEDRIERRLQATPLVAVGLALIQATTRQSGHHGLSSLYPAHFKELHHFPSSSNFDCFHLQFMGPLPSFRIPSYDTIIPRLLDYCP